MASAICTSLKEGKQIYETIQETISQSNSLITQIQKTINAIRLKTEDFEISCGNAQKEESMLRSIVEEMDKYLSYYAQMEQVEQYFALSDRLTDADIIPKYMQLQELLDFFSSHADFMDSEAFILRLGQIKMGILKQLFALSTSEFKKHKSSLTSMIILEVNLHNAQPSLIETIIYQHNKAVFPLCSIFKFIMNDANKRKDIDCINIMYDIKETFIGNRYSLAAIYFQAYQNMLKADFTEDFVIIFKHLSTVISKEINYFLQYFRESCSILQEYKDALLKMGLDALTALIAPHQSIDKLIGAHQLVDTMADEVDCCFQNNREFINQLKIALKHRMLFLLEIYVTQSFLHDKISSQYLDYYTTNPNGQPLLPSVKEALNSIRKLCPIFEKSIIISILSDLVQKAISKVQECQSMIKYRIRKHLFAAIHYFFLIKQITTLDLNIGDNEIPHKRYIIQQSTIA